MYSKGKVICLVENYLTRWNSPKASKSSKVINPEFIIQISCPLNAVNPPRKSIFLHGFPIIQRAFKLNSELNQSAGKYCNNIRATNEPILDITWFT